MEMFGAAVGYAVYSQYMSVSGNACMNLHAFHFPLPGQMSMHAFLQLGS